MIYKKDTGITSKTYSNYDRLFFVIYDTYLLGLGLHLKRGSEVIVITRKECINFIKIIRNYHALIILIEMAFCRYFATSIIMVAF